MSKNEPQPRRALGKGMGALLPTRHTPAAPPPAEPIRREEPYTIAIDLIDANPLQPRSTFDPETLRELAQSIDAHGIVQPLVLRRHGDRYQLVAGERRLRAARLAHLKEVPAVIREIDDRQLLQVTLIENIQREDLNPIETAIAFRRLGSDLGIPLEQVAQQTGKDRTTIINLMRLLQLPEDIQQMLVEHKLTPGHGRALLRITPAETLRQMAHKAIGQGWSVRQLERIADKMLPSQHPQEEIPEKMDPNTRAAIEEMERALGTKVRIHKKRKGGRIEIDYYNLDDLHRIYAAIVGEP